MNNNLSYYEKNKEKILAQQQAKRDAKYIRLIEGYDYICCKECGFKSSELATHIINRHNITVDEYKLKHNVSSVKSQKSIDRVKGKNNPAYQHGGKYSPFSENYIHGTNKIEEVKKKAKENKKLLNKDSTKIEYWLEKTNGDLEKAKELLSERQSTFSLEKCIKKYGEEKGHEIWLNRQEKWQKNYKKNNFSKVSQDLFWNIVEQLNNLDDIFFAQLDENKNKDISSKNHELTLKLDTIVCKPDFLDKKQKKIIEFNGTYWHKVKNSHYSFENNPDNIRKQKLIDNGYSVLYIEESEYKKDKQGTIQKCLSFLKE